MIDEIQVENLALIEHASFTPCAGLTVLTGETGAGKTALLSACKLLMGERASADAVRDGAQVLKVSGRFYLAGTDEETVVQRRVTADGKSRANINGSMASAGELAELVGASVDLCGQHEHQRLLKPAAHLAYLDAWQGESTAQHLQNYQEAFECAKNAARELDVVQEAANLQGAAIDDARFTCKRFEEVNPKPGEYEELLAVLEKAENAEALALAASGACEALQGDSAALDALNAAVVALEKGSRMDTELKPMADSLRDALYIVEDIAGQARDYRDSIEFDAQDLAHMQERVGAMQGLMRTYGQRMEDVFERYDAACKTLELVSNSEEHLKKAQEALDAAEEELAFRADELDAARAASIPEFENLVNKQMERLNMGSAALVCTCTRLDRAQWTKQGPSSYEFLFKAGEGMAARPLAKIASGGELSRVMLALKVVLGEADTAETLVFDEIDAGVGGATAVALADVLADLAKTHQVIVVTHLAQVAVRAQAHFLVEKTAGEMPTTTITELTGEDRVAEVARMLSGDTSQTSLAHARELLEV